MEGVVGAHPQGTCNREKNLEKVTSGPAEAVTPLGLRSTIVVYSLRMQCSFKIGFKEGIFLLLSSLCPP